MTKKRIALAALLLGFGALYTVLSSPTEHTTSSQGEITPENYDYFRTLIEEWQSHQTRGNRTTPSSGNENSPSLPGTVEGVEEAIRLVYPSISDCHQAWATLNKQPTNLLSLRLDLHRDDPSDNIARISSLQVFPDVLGTPFVNGCILNALRSYEFTSEEDTSQFELSFNMPPATKTATGKHVEELH